MFGSTVCVAWPDCRSARLLSLASQVFAAEGPATSAVEVEVEVAELVVEPAAVEPVLVEDAPGGPVPEFVATHEWQPVLPGQTIPTGLWVRMDITSGVKMARLLPEEELNAEGHRLNARRANMAVVAPEELACDPITDASCVHPHPIPHLNVLPEPGSEEPIDVVTPQSENALRAARQERLRLLKEHFYLVREHACTVLRQCDCWRSHFYGE
jgi:hypothetical protein